MRYERLQDIVRLAIRLQGALGGLTLDGIQDHFRVSRSTAERMRNAVDAAFGPLESVDIDDNRSHWRLRSDALRRLVSISAGELTELGSAATALERAGLDERAAMLRDLATKLRATMRGESLARIESDVETLVHAEGLATRPGPKQRLDAGLLALLREAITGSRVVEFRYLAQSTGRRSRQCVQPYGLLYGNRAFLVGRTDWSDEPRLWRLANMSEVRLTEETFERDPAFDLQRYARRSFGTFQEETRQGRPAIRRFGCTGCIGISLPSGPVLRGERRRLADGAIHRGRHRRDVLASDHVGRERHSGETCPSSPTAR